MNYEICQYMSLAIHGAVFEPKGPFITRLLRSERRGMTSKCGQQGIVVHWGDGSWEIAEAVKCLVKELRK